MLGTSSSRILQIFFYRHARNLIEQNTPNIIYRHARNLIEQIYLVLQLCIMNSGCTVRYESRKVHDFSFNFSIWYQFFFLLFTPCCSTKRLAFGYSSLGKNKCLIHNLASKSSIHAHTHCFNIPLMTQGKSFSKKFVTIHKILSS